MSLTTIFSLKIQLTLGRPTTAATNTACTRPSAVPVERSSHDFLGYTTYTRENRHDSVVDLLPPYAEDMPPTYSLKAPEPVTLPECFFKFGFLFPPFWILGACFVWLPLREPDNHQCNENPWMADKTEVERQYLVDETRKAEVRWAMRCIWALIVLIVLGAICGIISWGFLHM